MYKQAIEKFRDQKDWYLDIHDYIFTEYQCPHLFCGLLAATSPQNQVRANWRITVILYDKIMNHEPLEYWKYRGYLMKCHKMNIDRLLNGEPLHGDKVKAFYLNLIGDYQAVTIDGWMLKFFRFDGWITKNRYAKFADRVRNQAKKYDLEPAELQAICWSWQRFKNGNNPKSFLSVALSENEQDQSDDV